MATVSLRYLAYYYIFNTIIHKTAGNMELYNM